MTAMGKHITVTTIDGRVIVIETLTGVQWRIERVIGSTQAGAAVGMSNFIMEMAPEGEEHRLMAYIDKERERLQREFAEARGLGEATYQTEQHT